MPHGIKLFAAMANTEYYKLGFGDNLKTLQAMGEIAEDKLDGTMCELCGCYFRKDGKLYTHEHPAVCWDCWADLSETEKKQHTKSEAETF